MENISRSQFKYNFLKQVILRLDFQGVLTSEMDNVLSPAKRLLKDKGFNRYEKRTENGFEIQMGIHQGIPEAQAISGAKPTEVHSFINETKGYAIDLSSNHICLKVNSTQYIPFEEYKEVFSGIAKIYQDNIDFFTATRFGLRKINFCFLNNLDQITKYFNSSYFQYHQLFSNTKNFTSERKETLQVDDCKLNLLYGIEQGLLNQRKMYKITLDSDIYLDETRAIEGKILKCDGISDLNEKLFEIYVDALSSEFIALLSNENTNWAEDIKGVERNE